MPTSLLQPASLSSRPPFKDNLITPDEAPAQVEVPEKPSLI